MIELSRESVDETERIRAQFPILLNSVDKIFFDNAATTQKPNSVLSIIERFNREECSNAGRANYSWSARLAREIETSRSVVAEFLGTDSRHVAFTSGATDSLNLIAQSWGMQNLVNGDEIMVCFDDHRSAVLPWFNLKHILERFNIHIKLVPFFIHPSGTYDRKSIQNGLTSRTKLISISHIHHVYGMEMDISEIKKLIPDSVLISLDASQSAGHIQLRAAELGVDFISFSGHKMFAANGIGVLWTSERAQSEIWPTRVGAKSSVVETAQGLTLHRGDLSGILECGTLNLPAILSMNAAIDFIHTIGWERIEEYISTLTKALTRQLKQLPGIEFAPGIGVCDCTRGFGIVSFRFTDTSSADIGTYLDEEGIFVRTGDHCLAHPNAESEPDYIRVSLQIYNTVEEIDSFIEVLRDACC